MFTWFWTLEKFPANKSHRFQDMDVWFLVGKAMSLRNAIQIGTTGTSRLTFFEKAIIIVLCEFKRELLFPLYFPTWHSNYDIKSITWKTKIELNDTQFRVFHQNLEKSDFLISLPANILMGRHALRPLSPEQWVLIKKNKKTRSMFSYQIGCGQIWESHESNVVSVS